MDNGTSIIPLKIKSLFNKSLQMPLTEELVEETLLNRVTRSYSAHSFATLSLEQACFAAVAFVVSQGTKPAVVKRFNSK